MDCEFISQRIAQLRMEKGVSARDMSLSIGQNENYINHIENGKMMPSLQVFFYICDYFTISASQFFATEQKHPAMVAQILDNLSHLGEDGLKAILAVTNEMLQGK